MCRFEGDCALTLLIVSLVALVCALVTTWLGLVVLSSAPMGMVGLVTSVVTAGHFLFALHAWRRARRMPRAARHPALTPTLTSDRDMTALEEKRIHPETGTPLVRGVRTVTLAFRSQTETIELPGWYPDDDLTADQGIHDASDMQVSDRAINAMKAREAG